MTDLENKEAQSRMEGMKIYPLIKESQKETVKKMLNRMAYNFEISPCGDIFCIYGPTYDLSRVHIVADGSYHTTA